MAVKNRHALDRYRRVLITGAQSCGKSTLAKGLAPCLGMTCMAEAARDVLEKRALTGGQLFGLASWEKESVQRMIFEEHVCRKHGAARVVLDRGEIDSYVYSLLLMSGDRDCEDWLRYIEVRARLCRDDYDAIFLCPPTIPFVEDGLRQSTHYAREVQHLLFKGALDQLGYDYYAVTATTAVGRVAECLAYLGGKE